MLGALDDDDPVRPTPCTDDTVGDLVDHVDKGCRGLVTVAGAPLIGPDDTAEPAAAHVRGDPRQDLAHYAVALAAAWSDPRARTGSSPVAPGVDLPNAIRGRIAPAELDVHGCDLARANGRPFALPDDVLRDSLDRLLAFVPTAPVAGLGSEPVAVPPGTPLLDRVVAAAGRRT